MTPRTDVYSLGCVLFEALTGRSPYKRENDLATLWAHVYTPPPSVVEVAPDIPAGIRGSRAAGDGQGPGGALCVRGRARSRRSLRRRRGGRLRLRRERRRLPSSRLRPASGVPRSSARWRPGRRLLFGIAGCCSWSRPSWRSCCSRIGRPEDRQRRLRAFASPARGLDLAPPPPDADRAPEHGERGAGRDGLGGGRTGSRFQRLAAGRGLRPRDQRLEVRSRPAGPAAPRDGRHLQGGAGRDRRLDPEGVGSERRGHRPRVRPARRKLGRAALPAPAARGGGGRRGRRPDRGRRRPGRRPPDRHHRGVRRQAVEHRREDPDPA